MNFQSCRRSFCLNSLKGLVAAPIALLMTKSVALAANYDKEKSVGELAKTDTALAKQVKDRHYIESVSGMKDRPVKKAGCAANEQECKNCILYAMPGTSGGKPVGKCAIFMNKGFVPETAWCDMWAKKGACS